MKKVKCYGRKKTTLVETSIVRKFFGDFSPQNKICSERYDTKKKGEIISFDTLQKQLFPTSPDNIKCIKSNKNNKKVSYKVKTSLRKFKKYKGKRIVKRNDNQLCKELKTSVDVKEPRWDSINEHSLAVECNFKKIGNFAYNATFKNVKHKVSFSDNRNSRILSHVQSFTNFPVPCTVSFMREKNPNSSFDRNDNMNTKMYCSKMNKLFSPVTVAQSKLGSIRSLSSEIKNPVTSTPVFHHVTSSLANINVSNLSPIHANKKELSNKRELTFETSFSKILVSKIRPSRSLKINNVTSLSDKNECSQQGFRVLQKAYTNVERSIFIKSHSSLKEVLTENREKSSLPKLLELCNQSTVLPFMDVYTWSEKTIRKVGEGSYGEVFMVTQNKKSSVIKVIPLSEEFGNNLQSIESVYSEIKVSQCLCDLRSNKNFKTTNFLLLQNVYIVQGSYPKQLLNAWDKYSESKTTYNYKPDIFDDQQIYTILELEYGGKDMSSFVLRNGVEAESVFKQITISLAIAEETHLFEHRDLHLGNILIQRTKTKYISYVLRGKSFSIPSEGVFVTLIDFTLSRILDGGCIYYNDLAEDESLFNQSGDFQFEVYKATKLQLKNQWHECLLYSNVLWLNYLCIKLQEHEYSRPSSIKHARSMKNIEMFSEKLKLCRSAFDCMESCKILSPIPEKLITQESNLNSKGVLIDRKSFQKTSFCTKT